MFVCSCGGDLKLLGVEVEVDLGAFRLGRDRRRKQFTVDEATLPVRWFETYQHCRCIDDAGEVVVSRPMVEEVFDLHDSRLLAIVEEFSLGQLSLCSRAIVGE